MMATMLISERMAEGLSYQVGREFHASIQYEMLAAYFEREALPNLATRYRGQAEEERGHALKLIAFLNDTGAVVRIPAIEAGQAEFSSPLEALELALQSETEVTEAINALMDIALEEHDHMSRGVLQWFVDEQLEEVATADALVIVARRAGDDLLYLEQYVSGLAVPGAEGNAPA
ncbi:MAG: ferritin [Chloroflexi bacterium]|nr:ferritin [Chloroflexota bacterium]